MGIVSEKDLYRDTASILCSESLVVRITLSYLWSLYDTDAFTCSMYIIATK